MHARYDRRHISYKGQADLIPCLPIIEVLKRRYSPSGHQAPAY